MRVATRLRRVELQVGGAPLARPGLGRVEQRLADALGSAPGVDREVLDPGPIAEADRVEVLICGADADQRPVAGLGYEDAGVMRLDRAAQGDHGSALIPGRRPRAGVKSHS